MGDRRRAVGGRSLRSGGVRTRLNTENIPKTSMAAKKTTRTRAKKTAKKRSGTKTPAKAARKVASKHKKTPATPIERLRAICLSLPEAHEVEAWGEPTFRVKNKIFAMHASSGTHHSPNRPAVWILSVSIEQDLVLRARPDKYFKPPYVGPSGWIGAWLDGNPPWGEIEELLRDGWRRRAPKKVAALLDS